MGSKRDFSFKERRRELDKQLAAITELSDLIEFARPYLLAMADESEYADLSPAWARVFRARANDESYCRVQAFYWLARRLKKEQDGKFDLTPAERAAIDAKHQRETEALWSMAEALLRRPIPRAPATAP